MERAIAGGRRSATTSAPAFAGRCRRSPGKDRAYIEETKLVSGDGAVSVEVKLRLPMEESDDELRLLLAPAADTWLRRHLGGLGRGGARAVS